VLAVEGLDASGKTSIARAVAEELEGTYVKPYVGTVGTLLNWLHLRGEEALVNDIGRAEVARLMEVYAEARCIVFDRHWLSILSVISSHYSDSWFPPPPTIVCVADAATTEERLRRRATPAAERRDTARYGRRFRELAQQFALPTLDTSRTTVDQAVAKLLADPVCAHLIRAPGAGAPGLASS